MAVKIQIDNSLGLGWSISDILLVTNFDYEYNGVRALVIGNEHYCRHHWPATKVKAIVALFRAGRIESDLYWYHDFDCFQLAPFTEPILSVADLGLTNYGRMPRLCSASIFFRETAGDIFKQVKAEVDNSRIDEERALMRVVYSGTLGRRVCLLNISYAFHRFNLRRCYAQATKPLKAAHFHLTPDKYDFFVRGNNKLGMSLIPDRLIEVFKAHGWTG